MKERRSSAKRDAILELICSTDTHPTAEWVHTMLKPRYPGLSLGTVYRNLSEFRARGEIISVGIVGGQERFDGNTSQHAHLVCTNCGAVEDIGISSELDKGIAKEIEGGTFESESYRLTFYGTCKSCKNTG